ncbi:hypothetical protein [Rhodopirellula halodulae]|uniref:hypothetical protein n=1 Tax=Rhodopirellula halodulae TaxID=2894198 RepID=UPI001E34C422|nr:hypothetical protein [Rhodopirellula sp. JC737]MCC9657210.1 hypothetical protein [Rhodopirellula sp. JC737]
MTRSLALSLGSLAMGLVVLRGLWNGEMAETVAAEAIGTLIIFMGIGGLAGAIADHLIRDGVEDLYRKRVKWFQNGVAELGLDDETQPTDQGTTQR